MVTAIVTGLDVGIYGTGKESSCRTLEAVVRSEVTFCAEALGLRRQLNLGAEIQRRESATGIGFFTACKYIPE